MENAFFEIKQNNLHLKLLPVSIKEIIHFKNSPCNFYIIEKGVYRIILRKKDRISKEIIKYILQKYNAILFISQDEKEQLVSEQQTILRYHLRSLSVEDPAIIGTKTLECLAINLNYLYQDPMDDYKLTCLYQGLESFAPFLINNTNVHKKIYFSFLKNNNNFIITQPLISSLFLSGILKQSNLVSDKEITDLFITSCLKDIGMSLIPKETYEKQELTNQEKEIFRGHAQSSVDILNERIPLPQSYFLIIKHHHFYSSLDDKKHTTNINEPLITGIETTIVTITDIIAAMISHRPYRKPTTVYNALELVKHLFSDQYPQEFRLLVNYFKQFFSEKD